MLQSKEKTGVKLPTYSKLRGQRYRRANDNAANENTYTAQTNKTVKKHSFTEPFLYKTPQKNWVLLSEAGLNGDYAGSQLYGKDKGNLNYQFAPEQKGNVKTDLPFSSPWRFAVIGNPQTIGNNMMPETLSPKSKVQNTSWIQPGTSDWTWLNGDLKGGHVPATGPKTHHVTQATFKKKGLQIYKHYVDVAAQNGWKYQTLDEGWQPANSKRNASLRFDNIPAYDSKSNDYYHGYYPWTKELIQYAQKKHVKLIAWINRHDLKTSQQRKQHLDYLSKLGISGFKIDFFNNSSQSTLQLLDKLYRQTAKDKSIIDFHGITKPTGEERTWPQQLNREAVTAAEQYSTDDSRDPKDYGGGTKPQGIQMTAANDNWLPFTRGAVGPTDYDPMASYNANINNINGPKGKKGIRQEFKNQPQFTLAHMTAMPVILQGGVQILADKPSVYRNSPAYEHYWKNLPSQWDESRVLNSIPGSYTSIARRHGINWYIGAISAYKHTTTKNIKLNFLKPGTVYKAYIYQDNPQNPKKKINQEIKTVTNKDSLDLKLVSVKNRTLHYSFGGKSKPNTTASGGAVIKLEPVSP